MALYALNLELARTATSVTNPLVGEMRLVWWREGLDELSVGRRARAPALEGLAGAVQADRLDRAALDRLIEARRFDLDPEPFLDEPALTRYLDDTAGALMLAAARLLAPETPAAAVQGAGRAWGWAAWLRAAPAAQAAGRRWAPLAWGEAGPGERQRHIAHRVADALAQARTELTGLPPAAFPAVCYAGLSAAYARAMEPGPLAKRARLTWASLTGRL